MLSKCWAQDRPQLRAAWPWGRCSESCQGWDYWRHVRSLAPPAVLQNIILSLGLGFQGSGFAYLQHVSCSKACLVWQGRLRAKLGCALLALMPALPAPIRKTFGFFPIRKTFGFWLASNRHCRHRC